MSTRRRRPPAACALLIDGMGTLVTLQDPVAALRSELAALGIDVCAGDASAALRAEIAHYRAHMLQGADAAGLAGLRADCAAVLRDALPAAAREIDTENMTAVLMAALRFGAFDDAREALLAARRRGARIVVVSNWDISLSEVLEDAGLAPLVDSVITSAAVGAAKPSAAIFTHALAIAGVGPERAIHVGDSVAEDVLGARACGIASMLVGRGRSAQPPPAGVVTVPDLTAVDALWPTFGTDP